MFCEPVLSILGAMHADNYLIRYGVVPEVARFRSVVREPLDRGTSVVVSTHRGLQLGTVLERLATARRAESNTDTDANTGENADTAEADDFQLLRQSTGDDEQAHRELQQRCEAEFPRWLERIAEWQLSLELIDLEWTLDGSKLILYVLTERGPDTTNLALQAAAAGLGIIEVQPISAEGLISLPSSDGGGCGSGGCGCHS